MEGVLVSAKMTGSNITTTVVTDEKGHYAFPVSRMQARSLRDRDSRRRVQTARSEGGRYQRRAKAASADLALAKVTDVHELGAQLTQCRMDEQHARAEAPAA